MLFLAMLAMAQSPSTGSSAGPSSSQNPPAPQSPLEDPKKPTEAEQNAPQAAKFDIGNRGASNEDQQLGEIRLTTRWTEVGGDPTRSFRLSANEINKQCVTAPVAPATTGTPIGGCIVARQNNIAEFNYFVDRRFLGTRRYQFLGMYRGTEDNSVDPEHNSLQKAYVRIFGPRDEYIFGDALVNFSRLSFNQNIKGGSFSSKVGDNWKVAGVGGIFIDRYGSLYKDLLGRPFMSVVAGGRVERKAFNQDSTFGLNFSSSRERVDSLPLTNPDTGVVLVAGDSPQPATNEVATFDARLLSRKGFRLDGEFAYSFTDFDRRTAAGAFGGCALACDSRSPQPELNRVQGDWGARLESSYRYKKVSIRGSYVRYQPNFASINARQIADLQDWVVRTSYELTEWLSVDGTVRRSNDDLRNQKSFQTTLWGPEARFVFHDLPFYKRGVFEFGYRHRDVSSTDGSANRFVRTPYAEFTIPVKQTYFSIGYERRQAQDRRDGRQTSNTDRVFVGLRGIYDIANWEINPSFRWELERQTHRPGLCGLPVPPTGVTLPPDQPCNQVGDPLLVRDSNRLGSANLYIQAPRWFILEGAFRASTATLNSLTEVRDTAACSIVPPGATCNLPVAPYPREATGFSRPSYRGALSYKIRNDENMMFTFSFERNNNFYFTSPNYDERVWAGSLLYRFGRRGQ
ncbi:MAG TPA: hypothetical protein VM009_04380 [Terriglobales bacterium]|nr:hypothetical protein [Terriglobales bacterium]